MKWIGLAVVLAPVAFALTIALLPLWSWIEAEFSVESIGHFGPAEWCYLATYAATLGIAFMIVQMRRRRRAAAQGGRQVPISNRPPVSG